MIPLSSAELRKIVGREELDYTMLMSILSPYQQPRKKISQWLADETLIRVKKGLYVFGPKYAQEPYSSETLANLIYGPSALSLEYALSFYKIIPERVSVFTCITPKKNKEFQTPIGLFVFRHQAMKKYAVGLTQYYLNPTHPILIATPEKALADYLYFRCDRNIFKNTSDLLIFLDEDLRADYSLIKNFDKDLLKAIQEEYKLKSLALLIEALSDE